MWCCAGNVRKKQMKLIKSASYNKTAQDITDDSSSGIKDPPAAKLQDIAMGIRFFAKDMQKMTPELMNELADNLEAIARDILTNVPGQV